MKPPRRGTPCRRFSVLDGMILVAGVAVGIVGGRWRFGEYHWQTPAFGLGEYHWETPAFAWHPLAGVLLMLASALVMIWRLRRPRPPIRLIASQPGAVACFAVLALKLAVTADTVVSSVIAHQLGRFNEVGLAVWVILGGFPNTSAAVVPIGWALLLANRRWRPEPGWIDRSGRILGWAWIAWGAAWPIAHWAVNAFNLDPPTRSLM